MEALKANNDILDSAIKVWRLAKTIQFAKQSCDQKCFLKCLFSMYFVENTLTFNIMLGPYHGNKFNEYYAVLKAFSPYLRYNTAKIFITQTTGLEWTLKLNANSLLLFIACLRAII